MALVNRKAEIAVEENAANVEVVEEAKAAVEETVVDEAAKPAKAEVAVRQTTAVSGPQSIWMIDDAVRAVVDTAEYGDFPQIIASQGEFSTNGSDGKSLGKWFTFKPIHAKVKLVCAPGDQSDEAKEYFAAAYEGETTLDGKTIEECVEDAKAAGYSKASVKEYIDLFAMIISQDSNDHLVDEVAILQLSPMSKIEWRKFSKKLEIQAAFGKLKSDGEIAMKAVAKATKNKAGQSFTHYAFELV